MIDMLKQLASGDIEGFISACPAGASVDTPLFGRLTDLALFADSFSAWLKRHEARAGRVRTTQAAGRVVAEDVLHLKIDDKTIGLPVALVVEDASARMYHSTWPISGEHRVRPPLLKKQDLHVPDVVGDYQRALAAGDLEGIIKAYAPDGCARQPSGGEYVACGEAALRTFYGMLFKTEGGIPLEHCTLTDDGVACAIEYNVVRVGKHEVPPQAGVAVYERDPASKRLISARIYDDLSLPE